MYIIFLGIIPLIALMSLFVYYNHRNHIIVWPKRSSGGKPYVSLIINYLLCRCLRRLVHDNNSKTDGIRGKNKRHGGGSSNINNSVNGVNSNQNTLPTISGSIRNLNLEIKQTGLISTTNSNVLNNTKIVSIKSNRPAPPPPRNLQSTVHTQNNIRTNQNGSRIQTLKKQLQMNEQC